MQYEGHPTHFSVIIDEFDESYAAGKSERQDLYDAHQGTKILPSHVYVNLEVDSIHFL